MKYPVIYVHHQLGTFKHGKVVETLYIDFQVEETFFNEEQSLRKKYLIQLVNDAYRAVEGQQVIAQATLTQVEDKAYIIFTSNLDKRLLKMQLQQIINELSQKLEGYSVSMNYAVFQSLLKIKGKDLFFHALKEGEPLSESDVVKKNQKTLFPNQQRVATNYLTSLQQFQHRNK